MESYEDKMTTDSDQWLGNEVVIAQNLFAFASDAEIAVSGENIGNSVIPKQVNIGILADAVEAEETEWNAADAMTARHDAAQSVNEANCSLDNWIADGNLAELSAVAESAATAEIAVAENTAALSVAEAPAELVITVDKGAVLNGGSETVGFAAEADTITLRNDGHAVVDLKANCITIANSSVHTLIGSIVTDTVEFSGADTLGKIVNVSIMATTRITFNDPQIIQDSKLSSGQIINNSSLTFKGVNTVVSVSQMSGIGALTWDITETAAYVNDYAVLNADMAVLVAIQVNSNQSPDIFVLADNAAEAQYFTLLGTSLSGEEAVLEVDGEVVEDKEYHRTYQLTRDFTNRLFLTVEATADTGLVFYNTAWTVGQEVTVEFRGGTYSGTVGDTSLANRFFNNYTDTKSSAGDLATIVSVQSADLSKYQSFDGRDVVMAPTATYGGHVFMGTLNIDKNKRWAFYEGSYEVTVDSGYYKGMFIGGDAGSVTVYRQGNYTLAITGGSFESEVVGGMAYTASKASGSVTHEGDVNFTISGGVFKTRVYGGDFCFVAAYSLTSRDGNVNMKVDCAQNSIIFGEDITVGSRQTGVINGNTHITFTGTGDNLLFLKKDAIVNGGCTADCYLSRDHREVESRVSGTRTLEFDEYYGEFSACPEMFTNVSFHGDSTVIFTASKVDFRCVTDWDFEYRSSASGITLNDFEDDTLNFDVYGMAENQWTVLTATNTAAFGGLWEAETVYINGIKANLGNECYTAGNFELSLSEDKKSMVISKLA